MRRTRDEKSESRAWAFANADAVEWQRQIENPDVLREIKRIQQHYGLPVLISQGIKHISAREVFDWMGWREPIEINETTGEVILGPKSQRRENLESEINVLITRFGIPIKFFNSLHQLIVVDSNGPDYKSMGFPSFNFYKDESGKLVHECIITPETDLGTPIILDFIRQWQILQRDEIPHPKFMRDSSRQLDWRPVWEWRNRHPDVSDAEIAKMLGKNRVTVSRALEKLDKENSLQK